MSETGFGAFFKITRGALLLRGIILIALGILMLFKPITLITVLTVIIGLYLMFEAIVLFMGSKKTGGSVRVILIINTLALECLGIAAVVSPLIVDWLWMIIGGVWLIIGGLQYFTMPTSNKAARQGEWITGTISLLAGIAFILMPFGIFTFIGIIAGIMLIIAGISVLGLSAALERG